jgi:hypothetical protein
MEILRLTKRQPRWNIVHEKPKLKIIYLLLIKTSCNRVYGKPYQAKIADLPFFVTVDSVLYQPKYVTYFLHGSRYIRFSQHADQCDRYGTVAVNRIRKSFSSSVRA